MSPINMRYIGIILFLILSSALGLSAQTMIDLSQIRGGSTLQSILNIKTATPAAIGDAKEVGGVTWTGSSATTITSPTSVWQASDVGKLIFCNDTVAYTNTVSVGTKIASFISATSVTISQSTIASTTGSYCVWYTQDDTAAFQAANAAVIAAAPKNTGINGNWNPTGSQWAHTKIYMPCGGYVISGPIFVISGNYQGIGLVGESEGCVSFFISPSVSFGSANALISIAGPVNNSYLGDFNFNGVNFQTIAYNNKQIIYFSAFYSAIDRVGGTNVVAAGGSNGSVLNIASSGGVTASNLFIQNNVYGGCEISSSGSIALINSLCSNNGTGGNNDNLLLLNNTGPNNLLGGKIDIVGGIVDECPDGNCTQLVNSTGVVFQGATLWSSHDETAVTLDGTSEAEFTESIVSAYNNQTNSTALKIASGGVARIKGSRFLGTGTGYCFNNAGSIYDLGGNICTISGGGGRVTGSGAFFGSASITGSSCVSGNLAASAGWGSTAAFSSITGSSNSCTFTLTNSGSGQGANPTLTFTFPTPFWVTPSGGCQADVIGGNQSLTATSPIFALTSLSNTAVQFTYNATPSANDTEQVRINCSNP